MNVPPSHKSSVPKPKVDVLDKNLNSLISLVLDLKASQSNEAMMKELADLKKKVEVLERKDISIDTAAAQEAISKGLKEIDAQRQKHAGNLIKQSKKAT